jgi:hypothetical protein
MKLRFALVGLVALSADTSESDQQRKRHAAGPAEWKPSGAFQFHLRYALGYLGYPPGAVRY